MKQPIFLPTIFLLIMCGSVLTSCNKFVDAGSPKSELTTDKVFADSTGAAAAVTGVYITLNANSTGITLPAGLASDELSSSKQGAETEFFANNIKPANALNASLWTVVYQQLYQANACIEGINGSGGLGTLQKERLSAEARGIRAFLLFNLVNLYGPVPLVTMTDYQISRSLPRASADDVYRQILDDLRFAQSKLNKDAPDLRRFNYYAATALLARVYLYNKRYEEAASEAGKVIGSGRFTLMNEPKDVFLAGSKESIWRLVPVVGGRETWEASLFVPSSSGAVPPFVLSEGLLAGFTANDKRSSQWIAANTVSGRPYAYPFKYKRVLSGGAVTENYTMLRLAEQYLIRSEARANSGDARGAAEDLRVIQQRANAQLYTGPAAGLPAAIALERRRELFCEFGHRWFDLKRTGEANAVLGNAKPGWKPTATLFPVPQPEVDANSALTQNPGY
ncbi:MAG: RagB/SusD family nutrient uptake outer membrane protein [Mucilaginibacter sp.]|uniref:RagB/SusD family nutrient uptake outer membrane protein n=1 Tax=Mucilaginibacter sp. TaxID=1882438 RepID=UPI0032674020